MIVFLAAKSEVSDVIKKEYQPKLVMSWMYYVSTDWRGVICLRK